MKRSLAGFVVVAILCGAWWMFGSRATVSISTPIGPSAQVQHDSAELPLASDAGATRAASTDPAIVPITDRGAASTNRSAIDVAPRMTSVLVKVESSAHIPLAQIDVLTPNGDWFEIGATRGSFDIGAFERPLRVRATGHLPATIEKDAHAVVLEPEALFVVHATGLRSRFPDTRLTGVMGESASLPVVCEGFVDDDHWAAAVNMLVPSRKSALEPGAAVSKRKLNFNFRSKLEGVIVGACTLHSGDRIEWDAPLHALVERAPLRVTVKLSSSPASTVVTCRIASIDSAESRDIEHKMPWGHALLPGPHYVALEHKRAFAKNAVSIGSLSIDGVPLGAEIGVTLSDEKRWARGYARFVHDGTPRTIEIIDEPVVRGMVHGDETNRLVNLVWRDPYSDLFGTKIVSDEASGGLSLNTAFEVQGWTNIAREHDFTTPIPRDLAVTVSAVGYEMRELRVPITAPNIFDCGTIELTKITVDPWLYFSDCPLMLTRFPLALRCMTEANPSHGVLVHCGEREARGRPVYLDTARDPTGALKIATRDWNSNVQWEDLPRVPDRYLALGGYDFTVCFARTESGDFSPVPTRPYRVRLTISEELADAHSFVLAWRYRGCFTQTVEHRVATWKSGDIVDFDAPTEGCELVWWDDRSPKDVHRSALDRAELELDAR